MDVGSFEVGDWSACMETVWREGPHTSSSSSMVFQDCSEVDEECNLVVTGHGLHRKLVTNLLMLWCTWIWCVHYWSSCWNLIFFKFRYKPGQVSLEKDLILPYVPNVDLCDAKCSSESESKRKTLLFFRGRLKRNAVRILAKTSHRICCDYFDYLNTNLLEVRIKIHL